MTDWLRKSKVPAEEIGAEEEVAKCLMVLFNKETGLSTLEGSANLWPVIVVSRGRKRYREGWKRCCCLCRIPLPCFREKEIARADGGRQHRSTQINLDAGTCVWVWVHFQVI